jgi:two-component system, cell cycle sensor histidine kinase and response regulator CckA
VGQLAGGIAHDFNNLLQVIRGNAALARDELAEGSAARGDVEEIERAAETAAGLVRQLLAFSRRQPIAPEPLDLNEVAVGTDKMLRRLIGKDIELLTVFDPELGYVQADRTQVEQILVNLAVNARQAMPDGGVLTVETRNVEVGVAREEAPTFVQPGRYVALRVTDTGTGIAAEDLARIFEPFFTTRSVGGGTGLGLSVVYGIVKQSGGYVWADSVQGRYTSFTVFLPRVEAPEVVEVPAARAMAAPAAGPATILLVDDEASLRAFVSRVLARAGYRVLEAMNGEEALRLWYEQEGSVALVLTDLVMPLMNGFELARRLREASPRLPILFMSGYAEAVPAKEAGTDFIAKPFSPEELTNAVAAMLARPEVRRRA